MFNDRRIKKLEEEVADNKLNLGSLQEVLEETARKSRRLHDLLLAVIRLKDNERLVYGNDPVSVPAEEGRVKVVRTFKIYDPKATQTIWGPPAERSVRLIRFKEEAISIDPEDGKGDWLNVMNIDFVAPEE